MAKILYINLPAFGHINPTLNFIKSISKSNDVIYYSSKRFKKILQSNGVILKYHNTIKKLEKREMDFLKNSDIDLFSNQYSIEKHIKQYHECLIDYKNIGDQLINDVKKEKPNYIFFDSNAYWGRYIARKLEIPCVSSITTFALNSDIYNKNNSYILDKLLHLPQSESSAFNKIDEKISKMTKKIKNITGINEFQWIDKFCCTGDFNIVFTSEYIQPFASLLEKSFIFTGRNYPIYHSFKSESNIKQIYICMGSIINNCKVAVDFYKLCIEAFKNRKNLKVIISAGSNYKYLQKEKYENIFIDKFVDQLKVIQESDLVISHGGFNSIMECCYYQKPMLLVPVSNDQFLNADRMQILNTGDILNSFDKNEIYDKTINLLLDNQHQIGLKKASNSLKQYDINIITSHVIDCLKKGI